MKKNRKKQIRAGLRPGRSAPSRAEVRRALADYDNKKKLDREPFLPFKGTM